LVAFGVEHDEAAGAFVGGRRGKSGVHQDQVKHATLSRGHGRKGEGLACGSNLLDCGFGGELEIAVPSGFEAFCIEADAVVVFGFEAEDLGGDVLDSVEELAVMGEEQRGVGTRQFDPDVGTG
jgi:hypothetical protein